MKKINMIKIFGAGMLALSLAACSQTKNEELAAEPKTEQTDEMKQSGDTEKDYRAVIDEYAKKMEEETTKAIGDFNKEMEHFDGTQTEVQKKLIEYGQIPLDVMDEAERKLEAVYENDPDKDEDRLGEYENELQSLYDSANSRLNAAGSERMQGAREDR